MTTISDEYFRDELLDRRRHVQQARRTSAAGTDQLSRLLAEIDAALDRIGHGTYRVCEVCREGIEADRLARDPLTRCCSDHPAPDEAARVERDLALARSVQLGLLPPLCRTIDGWRFSYRYEAAGEVGGDFCDVIPITSRGQTLVLVGDVSGKGIAASMLMTSLLATFRSLSSLGLPTGELLARVNDLFHDTAPASSYATLAAAALAPDGSVDLYSAGHWPPLLRTGRMTTTVPIEPGLPLGLFAGSQYPATRVALHPSDTLLFFTDGAVEAENADGEDYGSRRLSETLASIDDEHLDALVAACVGDVRRFQDASRPGDDLLLFAVKAARAGRTPASRVA